MVSQGRPLPHAFSAEKHRFEVAGHKGKISLGRYPDGLPGEIELTLPGVGTETPAYAVVFGELVSLGLQYGVPLKSYIDKFEGVRFDPSGTTDDPDIPKVTSILDYFSKRLALQVPLEDDQKRSAVPAAMRRRLPDDRQALTARFEIGKRKWYFTVGLYDDGTPGEVFIVFSKEGSTDSAFLDAVAVAISLCFQYGVPLPAILEYLRGVRFKPNGLTSHSIIKEVSSIFDCLGQWLDLKFGSGVLVPAELEEEEHVQVG